MNAEQRIRIAIGDLVIQLQAAHAQIEALQTEIQELKMPLQTERGNGKDIDVTADGRL
jgi:prefoldin subunit 5